MQDRDESIQYRLVTRSDFDGLVCAVLLEKLGILDGILFVHPKDVQDGKIEITDRDITTNLPYVEGCHLAFDHHSSETERVGGNRDSYVIDPKAASAARVVYDYFGGKQRFPDVSEAMMAAVDKGDSAQFTPDEILHPQGWTLMNFLMDARTGLGRFREFRISNYALMMKLIDYCQEHDVEEILELPDVAERVQLYREHEPQARKQIERCSTAHGNLIVLDIRNEETIYVTNRFTIYAMYPQCNISMHVLWGLKKQNTVFAIGNSILDRSSRTDIGSLCPEFGGGGHRNAGTCQIDNDAAEKTQAELVRRIRADQAVEKGAELTPA